jgi:prolipoprotein diacylglyceryltransferase
MGQLLSLPMVAIGIALWIWGTGSALTEAGSAMLQ